MANTAAAPATRGGLPRAARRGLLMGLTMAVLLPASTLAWSQLWNNQDANNGQGNPGSCTDVVPWECIEWPTTSQGLSVTVEVYLSDSLDLITSEPIKTDFRNAWPQWNNIAARNPHYQETTSLTSDEVYVYATYLTGDAYYAYGGTTFTISSTNIRRITHSNVVMNRRISWNHSKNYAVTDNGDGTFTVRADSRKVAVHELGHTEGLGHVRPTATWAAIMRQGEVTYTTVQSNDNLGIKEIYGEYP